MRLRPASPHGLPDAWSTPRRWAPDEPSPFEAMRILDPRPDQRVLAGAQDAFAAAFPAIGRPGLRATWGGMIDTMPDLVPVIDRLNAAPDLVLATGFSSHGFGIGPGAGRLVAGMVCGTADPAALAGFRLGRFFDGSSIVPGPAI